MDAGAPGWRKEKADGYAGLASMLASVGGLGAHVHYPAPRIAYVKAVPEEVAKQRAEHPGQVEVEGVVVLTLRWVRGVGWQVFSAGPAGTVADRVRFPERDLSQDPRGDSTWKTRAPQMLRTARAVLGHAPRTPAGHKCNEGVSPMNDAPTQVLD